MKLLTPRWLTVTKLLDDTGKAIGIASTERDITERKQAEMALQERVNELNCLYSISELVETPGISLDEILQGSVDLIPSAWQYPEIVCARITLDDQEFKTANFQETTWKQSSAITLRGERIGMLDVCYLEERPPIDAGPFLEEEISLLDALAARLGRIIERKQAEEEIKHLNLVLRAIRGINQLIVLEMDRDRLIQRACEILIETKGYFSAWIALLDAAGNLEASAEAGLGDAFQPLREMLQRGELLTCGKQAMSRPNVVIIPDPLATCSGCPLSDKPEERGVMTVRLEHGGKVYGLINVASPAAFVVSEEEQSLLEEAAGDIAFALESLEREEARKQAEETREADIIRLDLALDASQIGVWELDLIKDTSARNLRHDQIFGYKKEIAEWGAKIFFEHIIPEDRPSVQAAFESAMKTGKL